MIGRATTWQKLMEQRHGSLFIGREREQELFRLNFLYQVPAHLIFTLHGPDGVGKSALLAQYRAIAEEHNAVTVQVDATQATAVREQTILQTMLRLAQQFAEAGTPFSAFEERYEEYMACTRMVAEDFHTPGGVFDLLGDVAEAQEMQTAAWNKYLFERFGNPAKIALVKTPVETLTQIFVKDMNAWATVRAIVIGFDDWGHLSPHLQGWLQGWLTRYEMRANIWLVLAGAPPLDETWTALRPVTATFTLSPFTEADTRAYLAASGIADAARVADIVTFSDGLPALARLLASAEGGHAGDLALTPVDRYLKWLEPPQRRDAVLQCAVARRLDAEIVQTVTDSADPDLSAWLLASPLIVPSSMGYARYHPELHRRLLAFAQQQAPALVHAAHTRLYDYYHNRSAAPENGNAAVPGGLTLYRDAHWRADKLEALYHGLMLRDAETVQQGATTFLAALRVYYPLAGEIAATWQEAAQAQLTGNPVAEWSNLLNTAWHVLEQQDWEAFLAFCDTCAQREDTGETIQRELQIIRPIVLARLGRFAPESEETAHEVVAPETDVPETDIGEATVIEEPVETPEPVAPEPGTQEGAAMAVAVVPVTDLEEAATPDVELAAKTAPLPRITVKETATPIKEDITTPMEPVTPKVGAPTFGAPKDEVAYTVEAPQTGEEGPAEGSGIQEELTMPEEPVMAEELAIPEETEALTKSEVPEESQTQGETGAPTSHSLLPTPPPDVQAADYHHRAAIYLTMGEYDKAIQECSKALELDPTYVPAYYDCGLAHAQQQQYADAVTDFSEVIALDPQHADAYYNRGLVYARQNIFDQALADYDQVLALHPEAPLIYNSRGNIHYNAKDYAQAITDYDQAIQHDPTYADAYLNRGLTYAAQEEYQHAIGDYNQTIALDPESAIAYNYRGQAYSRLQQYARALEDYTQAVTLDPNYAVAYNNRGLCYVHLDNHTQAIAEYRLAIIADPQYATAYYNAACAAGLMNNANVACTWLEKAIQLNPRYRTLAQRDNDFEYIRENKKFQTLLTE